MSNIMQWDELNFLRQIATTFFSQKQKKKDIDHFCDYLEFVLCLVYAYGWKDAEEIVGDLPMPEGLDDKTVNLEIAGKTFRERMKEAIEEEDEARADDIIQTESHRDYNSAVQDAGTASGLPLMKRWNTMLDDRVRETHDYLEGAVVGIDDAFFTFDGDSALGPGGFTDPSNNCGCRCYLTLERV